MTDSVPPPAPAFNPQMDAPRRAESVFRSASLALVFLRLCLYLLLANVIGYGVLQGSNFFAGREFSALAPRRLLAGELASFAGAFLAAWIMSRIEKRTFGEYGLPMRGAFGKLFWVGVVFGLAEISGVIGAMAALGCYRFGAIAVPGAQLLRWLIFWAVLFLIVGLYEEFAFRGYVQFTLSQRLGFWPAAVLLSAGFGAVHLNNPGETWSGILGVILTGFVWCFTLRRTGNLWFAVGMHASFDFGETFLYSVPDSGVVFPGHLSSATLAGPAWITGGTAGPEGSVFDFVLLLLLLYLVHRLFPRAQVGAPVQSAASQA